MKHTFLLFPEFKDKAITLSYDDGTVTDKRLTEIADTYGLKCTFNICSECFTEKGGNDKFTRSEAFEFYGRSGHEVAVHGAKHMSLTELNSGLIARELTHDKDNLERLFGRIMYGMAYANGDYNDRVTEIVRNSGLHYARTTVSTDAFEIPENFLAWHPTCHHDSPRLNELIEEFLADGYNPYFWGNKPKLFYLWGHSAEFERNDNWNMLENFGKKVGKREDIYYATNGEICAYVEAYRALQTSSDGTILCNPTCTDIFLNFFGQKVRVNAGCTVKF